MKRTLLSALALALLSASAFAQNPKRESHVYVDGKTFYGCRKGICEIVPETKEEKSSILPKAKLLEVTLQCSGSTDNRSGLAWNPEKKLYYSVNAGNSGYPIETFAENGSKLNSVQQGFDYRGLWWNPNTRSLEGNGYYSCGYSTQRLDEKGYALGSTTNFISGFHQPDEQSCATYNPTTNEIIHYSEGKLFFYSHKSGDLLRTVEIKKLPVSADNIGITSCVYTGHKGMEIGIYDFNKRAVYFIDLKTATYSGASQLPSDSHNPNRFRMAYCNNILWMFDAPTMKWLSYRVFDKELLPNTQEPEALVMVEDTLADVPPPVLMENLNEDLLVTEDVGLILIEGEEFTHIMEEPVVEHEVLTCGWGSLLEEQVLVEEVKLVEEPVAPQVMEQLTPVPNVHFVTCDSIYNQITWCCWNFPVCELPVGPEVINMIPVEPEVVVEPVVIEDLVIKEMNTPVEVPVVRVTLYPNPVVDYATIVINGLGEFNGTFTLIGNDGKVVRQMQVNATQFGFEREGLASGTYFYQVSNSGGVVGTGKIIFEK